LRLEFTTLLLWAVKFLKVLDELSMFVLLGDWAGMRKLELLYWRLAGSMLFFL
jgi:hypothetical protein